ncbi:MAG: glycosyltransferase family 39 protein [Candidatus Omnitrophica bacterium]|nr:glycosyltransferase family 39 protein [Candidatus Omnitrophota bacterium]
MPELRAPFVLRPRWDFYAGLIFLSVMMFQAASWYRFPLFLDDYYHLAVVQGFRDAGGWVGQAFWEYAPAGRPHLYPPLLHIIQLSVYYLGADLIAIARLSNVVVYPFFLFVCWFVARRIVGARPAFWLAFLLTSSESLYLAVINNIPFTLAFCFGLWSYLALDKGRWAAAAAALGLSFYTHNLVPWLFLTAYIVYAFFERDKRAIVGRAVVGALFLSFPLLVHQARYISYVRMVRLMDFYYVRFHLGLMAVAVPGIWSSLRRKGLCRFLLVLGAVFLCLTVTHRSRLFSGHGLFFLCFFGAMALDRFWELLPHGDRSRKAVCAAVLIFIFHILGAHIVWDPVARKVSHVVGDTPVLYWLGRPQEAAGIKAETIFYPKWIMQCVRMVTDRTERGDILFSNYNYAGGMVAVLSHRATSCAMLPEVRPFRDDDPVAGARWILWFKDASGALPPDMGLLAVTYALEPVEETEIAILWKRGAVVQQERVVASKFPFGICLAFVMGLLGAAAAGGFRPQAGDAGSQGERP